MSHLGWTLRPPEEPQAGGDGTGSKGSSAPFSPVLLLLLFLLLLLGGEGGGVLAVPVLLSQRNKTLRAAMKEFSTGSKTLKRPQTFQH